MNALQCIATPIGRFFIAIIFFMSGIGKITGYQATQQYMEMMGVNGGLLPLVILTEVLLGFAIIIGYKTRLAAFLLAGFCLLTAFFFHINFADQAQFTNFMKNIAIAGGFLILFAHGGGAFSIDHYISNKQSK